MIHIIGLDRSNIKYDRFLDYLLDRKISYEVIPDYELSDTVELLIPIRVEDTQMTATLWMICHTFTSDNFIKIIIE